MHFLIQMKKYSPTTLFAQCLLLFLLSYQQHWSTALENAQSKSSIVYMGERKHNDPSLVVDSHHTILATVVGGSKQEAADSIFYSYKHGFSGFAARLTDSQADMMAGLSQVVMLCLVEYLDPIHLQKVKKTYEFMVKGANKTGLFKKLGGEESKVCKDLDEIFSSLRLFKMLITKDMGIKKNYKEYKIEM